MDSESFEKSKCKKINFRSPQNFSIMDNELIKNKDSIKLEQMKEKGDKLLLIKPILSPQQLPEGSTPLALKGDELISLVTGRPVKYEGFIPQTHSDLRISVDEKQQNVYLSWKGINFAQNHQVVTTKYQVAYQQRNEPCSDWVDIPLQTFQPQIFMCDGRVSCYLQLYQHPIYEVCVSGIKKGKEYTLFVRTVLGKYYSAPTSIGNW
jgi:hypothetical protein